MNDIKEFSLSRHATARILDMQIQPREVQLALRSPERVVQCSRYPQCDLYDHGRITLSVDRSTLKVATVLWRRSRDWVKDIEGRGAYGSRKEARRCVRSR